MKKVKDTAYAFITPLVRSREARLLSPEALARMLEAPGLHEAAALAQEAGYKDLEPLDSRRLEDALNARRAAEFAELRPLVPQPELLDVFCLRYDYHNAKALIKAAACGRDGERLLSRAGRVTPEVLLAAWKAGELNPLPEALAAAMAEAQDTLSRTKDPQLADVVLDRAWLSEMQTLAQKAGSKFLQGYVRLCVDEANLRTALRVRRMGKGWDFLAPLPIVGGDVPPSDVVKALRLDAPLAPLYSGILAQAAETGERAVAEKASLLPAERLCERALRQYLKGAGLIALGPEALICYICALEREIGFVRTVLSGRLSGLDGEKIRERLREENG